MGEKKGYKGFLPWYLSSIKILSRTVLFRFLILMAINLGKNDEVNMLDRMWLRLMMIAFVLLLLK